MSEKRIFKRFSKKLNIKYEIYNSPTGEESEEFWNGETELLNISEGGILFTYDRPIPVGSFLEIEINVPEKKLPINLTGRIVRVEEIIPNKEYEIGFIFRNIFENDRKLLLGYIKEIHD
ncbi:MAG: PilZ domain-containing protein [Spirochaetota bacterium]|nr:PilZ domain-containing protein [Spirochaetota bacterium]